jgi:hypothetical protein
MPTVTFRSSRFSTSPAPDAVNAMLGRDLGEWLRARLEAEGFEVGEVIAEDYGYGFWLKLHGSHYWISQTQQEADDEAESPPRWLVGIDYDPGCLWLWRLRARPHPDDRTRIAAALYSILVSDADISGIEWENGDPTQG